jgi:hypothetical protein
MAEVDSRMKDLMDIGISQDKSLEGLVNDLAASCTDVPRLKGLARFLGYGGMDEYELAARLYDRCLDVHLTSLGTARMLWRDTSSTALQKLKGIEDSNALKKDSKPVEEICRALCGNQPVAASGAPDNSSLSHFSAMAWPRWFRRAARNRHRHAIEQASRRWRGGRRCDSA